MNSEQFLQWCQAPSISSSNDRRKPLIMGILNVTPDSFSDGNLYLETDRAVRRAEELIAWGADIIDIGGESSKPGAKTISSEEEMRRVIPVIERIRMLSDVTISIDTSKACVMKAAVSAGASFINDIMGLTGEGALDVAASLNVPVCLMHMQGVPLSMQDNPHYTMGVIDEINHFFRQRIDVCLKAGICRDHLILDPGFGYGKSVRDNLTIVKRLPEFQIHHLPLLLGVSRKSTIGAILQKTVAERLPGSIAVAVYAALKGVSIIRTHDVDETNQALKMVEAILRAGTE